VRVSRRGRLTYTFQASPAATGKAILTSRTSLRIGSKRRALKLGPAVFTAPAAGLVKLSLSLSRSALIALRRATSVRMRVSVTLGGRTFASTVTLQAPKRR
jgi:hypothetical protein